LLVDLHGSKEAMEIFEHRDHVGALGHASKLLGAFESQRCATGALRPLAGRCYLLT
jgi:hypothetical protein